MNNKIGKIEKLKLREVWKHEMHDLSVWLEENIDVFIDQLGLELSNAEREKAVGDFSVDLTAEDRNGNLVIIENQLEKSDHDHLGKIITYLSSLDAKTAIWIVSDPRPEHVSAVAWLNQSGLAAFYLVKLEAIKIEDSPPAPLLTLITGPSEESIKFGEARKEFSERQNLRYKWWLDLLDIVRKKRIKLFSNISASRDSWISTGAGKSGLTFNYVVGLHSSRIELYIDDGAGSETENKRIFDSIYKHKEEIESAFGTHLSWERKEEKRASRIAKYYESGGYRDNEERWHAIHEELIEGMQRFSNALTPYLKNL